MSHVDNVFTTLRIEKLGNRLGHSLPLLFNVGYLASNTEQRPVDRIVFSKSTSENLPRPLPTRATCGFAHASAIWRTMMYFTQLQQRDSSRSISADK